MTEPIIVRYARALSVAAVERFGITQEGTCERCGNDRIGHDAFLSYDGNAYATHDFRAAGPAITEQGWNDALELYRQVCMVDDRYAWIRIPWFVR